jgi:CubicO group peptidase (beta-lactamase class C family)
MMDSPITDIPAADLIARLDGLIPIRMKATDVPSLSIAVLREARVMWSKTYGHKHAELLYPAGQGTVFEAASLSKPVFAYGVLKLCARGALALDAPLAVFLPEPYIPNEPRLNLITARMVLSHTSGLQHWINEEGERPTIHFMPGSQFSYSSLGYNFLQLVLEKITAEPLHMLLQRQVLAPLGMSHSSFAWREDYSVDAATGHDIDGKPTRKWQPDQAIACASLHTTALDYARFMATMLASDADMVTQMLTPQVRINDSIAWGLGWGLERTTAGNAFWHWGDNGSFKAFCMGRRADQTGVVVLTNSANGLQLCKELVVETIGGAANRPAFAWLDEFYK